MLFDPGRFWFWVFGGANGGYLDVGNGGLVLVMQRMLSMNAAIIGLNLAMIGLAVLAWRTWRADLDVWLWLLSAVIGVSSGTRFFGHYYWQLLPPLCLLAARGSTVVGERWTTLGIGVAALTGAGAAIAAAGFRLGGPSNDYRPLADLRQGEHHARRADLRVGPRTVGVLGRRAPAPSIADHHHRLPDGPHRRAPDGVRRHGQGDSGLWDDVMADLDANPRRSSSTPRRNDPSASADYPIRDYPPMQEFLDEHYVMVDRHRRRVRLRTGRRMPWNPRAKERAVMTTIENQ